MDVLRSTPTSGLSTLTRVLLTTLIAVGVIAVVAPIASAETVPVEREYCGYGEGRGGGQMDGDGWLFLACARDANNRASYSVKIYDTQGQLRQIQAMNFGNGQSNLPAAVAPAPDGNSFYVTQYNTKVVHRFVGKKEVGYVRDAAFKLDNLPDGSLVRGEFLATDGVGNLYVSSGMWSNNADKNDQNNPGRRGVVAQTVAKFNADGEYITHFGRVANSWELGVAYDEFAGVAVTATGDRVFVLDKLNSRVHRFDRNANGTYTAKIAFGNTAALDPDRQGRCYYPGSLAAPYDLTMTAGGELLVINTSCYYNGKIPAEKPEPNTTVEVQRFAQNGASRGVMRAKSVGGARVHGIAVDRLNDIHLPQGGIKFVAPAGYSDAGAAVGGGGPLGGAAPIRDEKPVTGPIPGAPDTAAPILKSVVVPAASVAPTVSFNIDAEDDRGVTGVRIWVQQGLAWQENDFQAYSPVVNRDLPIGKHHVAVQVRDAAGNVSAWQKLWVNVVAPAPAAPVTPAAPVAPAPVAPAAAPDIAAAPANPVAPAAQANIRPPATAKKVVVKKAPKKSAKKTVKRGAQKTSKTNKSRARTKVNKRGASQKVAVTSVKMPGKVTSRRIKVKVSAKGNGRMRVRFAMENGKWGRWQPLKKGGHAINLTKYAGWKGVFVQVADAKGNRSRGWFQTVLYSPQPATWLSGTAKADFLRGTAGNDHIDASRFDGKRDTIRCGAGFDTVLMQQEDRVAKNCERVVVVKQPKW